MGSGSSSNKSSRPATQFPDESNGDANDNGGVENENESNSQDGKADNDSPKTPDNVRNVPGDKVMVSLPSDDIPKKEGSKVRSKRSNKSRRERRAEERAEAERIQEEEEERYRQEHEALAREERIRHSRERMKRYMQQMIDKASKEMGTAAICDLDTALEGFQKKYMTEASNKRMVPRVRSSISLHNEIQKNVGEKNRLMMRLSEVAGARLVHNNPVIADLSDPNRATKLAERTSELYDNQWTDLFEDAWNRYKQSKTSIATDRDIIICLRNIFHFCYVQCRQLAEIQRMELHHTLSMSSTHTSSPADGLSLRIKEWQKKVSGFTLPHINKKIKEDIHHDERSALIIDACKSHICTHYIETCVEISWYAQIQNPPVVISFDHTDTSVYRVYTRSGPLIDYIIWPVLFLHEGGPVLSKGVAQFKDAKKDNTRVSDTEVNTEGQPVYRTREEEYKFGKKGHAGGVRQSQTDNGVPPSRVRDKETVVNQSRQTSQSRNTRNNKW